LTELKQYRFCVRFKVFTAVRMMMMMFFWVLASRLKIETVCFSETSESTDESKRRRDPEEEEEYHYQYRDYTALTPRR
jgi:hypothetical protein